MSLGLCVGVCDCMTVDVVGSCMHTLELLMMGIVMPETC